MHKSDKMLTMNTNILIVCLIILCGGFGLMELFFGQPTRGSLWLLCMAAIWLGSAWYKKDTKKFHREPHLCPLTSVQDQSLLQKGTLPSIQVQEVYLLEQEICHVKESARIGYYDSAVGIFYVTNQRILFLSSDQRFIFPLEEIQIHLTSKGFKLKARNRKMPFYCSNAQVIWQTIELLKSQRS